VTAPEHHQLPLRDYDHLPLTALAYRIRPLTREELEDLLRYEREHANRRPVVQVFESRLAELAAGAEPSGAESQDGPDRPAPPAGGSKVNPAQAGPPANPPPHGVPAEPGQPKADRQA
jgi:hypothetical protein